MPRAGELNPSRLANRRARWRAYHWRRARLTEKRRFRDPSGMASSFELIGSFFRCQRLCFLIRLFSDHHGIDC